MSSLFSLRPTPPLEELMMSPDENDAQTRLVNSLLRRIETAYKDGYALGILHERQRRATEDEPDCS